MRIMITGLREDVNSALELFLQNKTNLEVVAKATDVQTMLTQAEATHPELILLDWNLSDQSLGELIQSLQKPNFQPGIILINAEPEMKREALAVGADALVEKGDPSKSLLIAIETVRMKDRDC